MIMRVYKDIKRRMGADGGFTFTELLLATIIMMLATTLLAQTMKLAEEKFFEITQESEAQLLCASLTTYIESELEGAEPVTESTGDTGINAGSTEGATAPRFNSDTHGMGPGAYFYVLEDTDTGGGGSGDDTSDSPSTTSKAKGQIVETSPYYQSFGTKEGNGGLGYYNIAGNGSYEVGKNHKYDLSASLDYSYSGGIYTVNIAVYEKNHKEKVLAENSFTVKSK